MSLSSSSSFWFLVFLLLVLDVWNVVPGLLCCPVADGAVGCNAVLSCNPVRAFAVQLWIPRTFSARIQSASRR
jgi:hypothetical protein